MNKSVDRAIPPPDHQQRPNRLERLAGNSHHGAQQSQKRHHQHHSIRSTSRLHASPTPYRPPSIIKSTRRGQETDRTREACTSDRSNQPHRPSNATTPVQRGSKGLARGKESPIALPDPQTSPQATRAFPHQQTSVTSGVSAPTTQRLEDPQRVPR
jgi:hypothetical protein